MERLTTSPTMIEKKVTLDTTVMPGCEHEWWNSEKYWRCYIARKTNPENHQTGTCRMGLASDRKLRHSNFIQSSNLNRNNGLAQKILINIYF